MTGYLLVAATTVVSLSLLVALLALSRWIADRLERRRCICLYEHWPAAIGIETQDDGSEWLVYPQCPVHGHQARTPIFRTNEAASEQLAA